MKKIIVSILFVMLSGVVHAQGTVIDTVFYSNALDSIRSVQIYLPPGYDPDDTTSYPVIYFLHGALDDHTGYPYLIDLLDILIGYQTIQPVIVVKPDGRSYPYTISWYTNSILNGRFEDYITYDLVGFVDANYRTIAERDKRCIMGHSAGGYGAIKLTLKHPDVYRAVASHSGPLDFHVMIVVFVPMLLMEYPEGPPYQWAPDRGFLSGLAFSMAGAFSPNPYNPPYYVDFPLDDSARIIDSVFVRWLEHDPPRIAAQCPVDTNVAIYFDCGTQDELGCYPQNTAFADSLDLLGFHYVFESYYGGHFSHIPARLPISLVFLDSVMTAPPVVFRVRPDYPPVAVPQGGSFGFTGSLTNNTGHPQLIDAWTMAVGPLEDVYGPMRVFYDLEILALETRTGHFYQNVPSSATPGDYLYIAYCGDFPSTVTDSSYFPVKVLPGPFTSPGDKGWLLKGSFGEGEESLSLPCDFVLFGNHPNPFNAITVIDYQLPTTSDVKLEVYNLLGKKVATLVEGQQQAGYKSVTWDASDVSSGIYFYKLNAGEYTGTMRMILVK